NTSFSIMAGNYLMGPARASAIRHSTQRLGRISLFESRSDSVMVVMGLSPRNNGREGARREATSELEQPIEPFKRRSATPRFLRSVPWAKAHGLPSWPRFARQNRRYAATLVARASSGRKIPRRERHRSYAHDHLSMNRAPIISRRSFLKTSTT